MKLSVNFVKFALLVGFLSVILPVDAAKRSRGSDDAPAQDLATPAARLSEAHAERRTRRATGGGDMPNSERAPEVVMLEPDTMSEAAAPAPLDLAVPDAMASDSEVVGVRSATFSSLSNDVHGKMAEFLPIADCSRFSLVNKAVQESANACFNRCPKDSELRDIAKKLYCTDEGIRLSAEEKILIAKAIQFLENKKIEIVSEGGTYAITPATVEIMRSTDEPEVQFATAFDTSTVIGAGLALMSGANLQAWSNETRLGLSLDQQKIFQYILSCPGVPPALAQEALEDVVTLGYLPIVQAVAVVPGVDINQTNEDGDTLIDRAINFGHTDIAAYLLTVSGVSAASARRALEAAVIGGHLFAVQAVVAVLGVDAVNQANEDGDTVIDLAAMLDQADIMAYLLTVSEVSVAFVQRVLEAAVLGGHLSVVQAVVAGLGADVVNQADEGGDAAIRQAAMLGHTDIVAYLLTVFGSSVASAQRALEVAIDLDHRSVVCTVLSFMGAVQIPFLEELLRNNNDPRIVCLIQARLNALRPAPQSWMAWAAEKCVIQ